MKNEAALLRSLLTEMRAAYDRGENVMALARELLGTSPLSNEITATLIAYDLQAGSYVAEVRQNAPFNEAWCRQLAEILCRYARPGLSIMEVGCGEATTLAGVMNVLGDTAGDAYGFDISWSRVNQGREWLKERGADATLFVGDIFAIPLASDSVDLVYTSHSLEPNGGREVEAITELLRVSNRWVVLVEPAYEFASPEAKVRMDNHGYVRGLRAAAEKCGATVLEHGLVGHVSNPLNPSGALVLEKPADFGVPAKLQWQCPISGTPLITLGDAFFAPMAGLAYPVLRGIPMLRAEHAIVASKLESSGQYARNTRAR